MLGIYCRISRLKEDGKDRSIEDLKLLGIDKAKELGIEYKLFIDEGISGYGDKIEDRPEFEKLLADITNGSISAVFAYDQSRFERNPQVRFVVNNVFKEYKVKYYTQVDGEVDLFDPQAEFFGDILSVINKFQVTMTKIKVKSVLKRRALDGKAHGIVPYGYMRDENGMLIIDPVESLIVKKIFELSLNGIGTRSIATILNNEGTPTRYKKIGKGTITVKNKYTKKLTTREKSEVQWAGNSIRGIITNPIYKGERSFGGIKISVPALLDEVYFEKVNANLKANMNNSGKKVVHQYLLKGLLRCGVCGRNMYGRARLNKHDYTYICSSKRDKSKNCGNRSINIDKIENFIWENLFYKEGFTDRLEKEFAPSLNKLQAINIELDFIEKSIASISAEKSKAIDLAIKGLIDESEFRVISRRLDIQLKENKLKLNEISKTKSSLLEGENLIKQYRSEFVDLTKLTTFSQKQKVINDFLENIEIVFNAGKYEIMIEYKHGMGEEYWESSNSVDPIFIRTIHFEDGYEDIDSIIPRSLKNPQDLTGMSKVVKKIRLEDEKKISQLIKSKKNKYPTH